MTVYYVVEETNGDAFLHQHDCKSANLMDAIKEVRAYYAKLPNVYGVFQITDKKPKKTKDGLLHGSVLFYGYKECFNSLYTLAG